MVLPSDGHKETSAEKETSDLYDEAVSILQEINLIDDHADILDSEIFKESIKTEKDIRECLNEAEEELVELENESVREYIAQASSIVQLNAQLNNCDETLEKIEVMLKGFQDRLTSISDEVQDLQRQSSTINVRLSNRQTVQTALTQLVDELIVPAQMIEIIVDSPASSDAFIEQVHELNHKMAVIIQKSMKHTVACRDVEQILQKLNATVIQKSFSYLSTLIGSLRKPMTNSEVVQAKMLKARFLYEYLCKHDNSFANKLRNDYTDTCSKTTYSYFNLYDSKLCKSLEEGFTKDDLLGSEDKTRVLNIFSNRSIKNKTTLYCLGRRASVVEKDEIDSPILVPHVLNGQKISYESIFRSIQLALLDTCCREYMFLNDFFSTDTLIVRNMFYAIFNKTFSLLYDKVVTWTSNTFDAISVCLCMQILYHHQIVSHSRKVPLLQKYHESLIKVLETRFQSIINDHINSLQRIDLVQRFGPDLEYTPHYITRRYAELYAAISYINKRFTNNVITSSLELLQDNMNAFIRKMADLFLNVREQLIFLINNYDLIILIMSERLHDNISETTNAETNYEQYTSQFIDLMLYNYFGKIMLIAQQFETSGSIDTGNEAQKDVIVEVARNFSSEWKKTLEQLSVQVMRSFVNFKTGQSILQRALKVFLQSYHAFQKALQSQSALSFLNGIELPNIHQVMIEVKKFRPSF